MSQLSEEIDTLKQLQQVGINESNQKFSQIEFLISDVSKRLDFRLNWEYFKNLSPKEIFAHLVALIVGVALGILIF